MKGSHNTSKLEDFLLFLKLWWGDSELSSFKSLEIVEIRCFLRRRVPADTWVLIWWGMLVPLLCEDLLVLKAGEAEEWPLSDD